MRDDFAVFICTHGRPDRQFTLNLLRDSGYTGKIYIVVDDTDTSIQQYVDKFGVDDIIVFNKSHYIEESDTGVSVPPLKCVLYAKNAVEDIAHNMGLASFVIADDDITNFRYRPIESGKLGSLTVRTGMDDVVASFVEYILESKLTAVSFCIAHYLFGGIKVYTDKGRLQKLRIPYNFVFRNASYKVDWVSAFGEDVVTALLQGSRGSVMLNIPFVQLSIVPLGTAAGGMQDTYTDLTDFTRAMFDFVFLPTAISLSAYKDKFVASIQTAHAFPMLVSQRYKKG